MKSTFFNNFLLTLACAIGLFFYGVHISRSAANGTANKPVKSSENCTARQAAPHEDMNGAVKMMCVTQRF